MNMRLYWPKSEVLYAALLRVQNTEKPVEQKIMMAAFLRLDEQAERNTAFVVEFERPTEKDSDPKPGR